jgi:hypothetical protein
MQVVMNASGAAPASHPAPLPVLRSAWLVNALALGAFLAAAAITSAVNFHDPDTYILIGVSGAAYVVTQLWSLVLGLRAVAPLENFNSALCALVFSMALANGVLLAIRVSPSRFMFPFQECIDNLGLAIVVPAASAAMLFCAFLARRFVRTRARERAWRLALAAGAALFALVVPAPLFLHLTTAVAPPDNAVMNEYLPYRIRVALVRWTPEFVAEAAVPLAKPAQYDALLRTGRLSTPRLLRETKSSSRPGAALQGLWVKDPTLATAATVELMRRTDLAFDLIDFNKVARYLATTLPPAKIAALIRDPANNLDFRNVLMQWFDYLNRSDARPLLAELNATPGLRCGAEIVRLFARNSDAADLARAWARYIQETDPLIQSDAIVLYRDLPAQRVALLLACMRDGNAAMQATILKTASQFPLAVRPDQRGAVAELLRGIVHDISRTHLHESAETLTRNLTGSPRNASKGPHTLDVQAVDDALTAWQLKPAP